MRCSRVLQLLSRHSAGHVTEELAVTIQGHLGDCEHCQREWQVLLRVLSLVETLEPLPAPDLWPRIQQRTCPSP